MTSLTLTGVGHDYGAGPVLHSVDLAVTGGRVHALLGMNGAGKSTLVHIGSGFFTPTGGELRLDGAPISFTSPADALRRGVALLAQEVDRALVPDATVHENLTVTTAMRERWLFSATANSRRAREILDHYRVDLDPTRLVRDLSLYEKQALSLVRVASQNARFLFLDEPTSAFDAAETERFYGIVEALTADGIGIVFISHRLGEVFRIADEVTVLRGGTVALHRDIADTSPDDVVRAITGELGEARRSERARDTTAVPALEATGLELGRGRAALDLRIDAGEVVAVYGPLGSGKTSLARTLFGLRGRYTARVDGAVTRIRSAVDARNAGLALVPEERRAQGIWLDESVGTHFALGFRGLIRSRRERAHAVDVIARYDVHPQRESQLLRRMSGGNQQKVAIGKWSSFDGRRVLILDEPMKGVDVAAKEAIFRSIEQLASEGVGVLYLTQEPDDALRIADRVVVLGRDGVALDQPASSLTALDLMFTERTDVA